MKLLHHILASAVCVAVLVATSTTSTASAQVVERSYSVPAPNEGVTTFLRGSDESDDSESAVWDLESEDDNDSSETLPDSNGNSDEKIWQGPEQTELVDSRRLATTPNPSPTVAPKPTASKAAPPPKPANSTAPPPPPKPTNGTALPPPKPTNTTALPPPKATNTTALPPPNSSVPPKPTPTAKVTPTATPATKSTK